MALTRLAHQLVREHFRDKATRLAVDATLGNGHDCKFLVELGFDRIIGFDIQQQAIEQTERQFTSSVKEGKLETQAVANAVDNVKHLKVSKHRSKSENETAPILYTLS